MHVIELALLMFRCTLSSSRASVQTARADLRAVGHRTATWRWRIWSRTKATTTLSASPISA
eukprot:3935381-Rhodomonas_salina.1